MPTRRYMVVDPRQDHSIRVPRPDLSVQIGTPNACNGCHGDRKPVWAAERVAAWYGPGRSASPHFATVFAAARAGDESAIPSLLGLAVDPAQPAVVRATALALLEPAGPPIVPALERAAQDADPWLPSAAASACDALPRSASASLRRCSQIRARRAHRAARVLSIVPVEELPAARARRGRGTARFEAAQRVRADLPGAPQPRDRVRNRGRTRARRRQARCGWIRRSCRRPSTWRRCSIR
jgi:hypothetical protein